MSRLFSSFALVAVVVSLGSLADAASCRGANGKFVKCPPAKTAGVSKPDAKGHCHGANGKFVKCLK
jgi:hypothetical protein